ncbi:hypothetical protein [Alkalimarinus coralli]|uniref:hypothetical protein n=1 Tax=Alkalimarinus coralli TaxID=2935863 RepID=UPI00202B60F2|nr:hypothetical protein [Alkalimarinus coralli]
MRLNHILLLMLVTLLFAGSASSSVYDLPAYQEISVSVFDLFDGSEGDSDSTGHAASHAVSGDTPNCPLAIGKALASPVQWKRARVIASSLTPQAPPA